MHVPKVIRDIEILDVQAFEVCPESCEDDLFATLNPCALRLAETSRRSNPLDVWWALNVCWGIALRIWRLSERLIDEATENGCYEKISWVFRYLRPPHL